jgi:6-oxo-cyclohex-1-ene-carbonyl-CoA hydrolase
MFYGLLNQVVPGLTLDGRWIPNPLVVTERVMDEWGQLVFGEFRQGAEREAALKTMARTRPDLSRLDQAVESLCARILMLMPECVSKTVSSLRKHKQWHWDNTSVTNREWLALNMMTEGRAGFRAFQHGPRDRREVDFVKLRQLLAEGHPWDEELERMIAPEGASSYEPVHD